jgi:hypothetical protein
VPQITKHYFGQVLSGTLKVRCGQLKRSLITLASRSAYRMVNICETPTRTLRGDYYLRGNYHIDVTEPSSTCQLFLLLVEWNYIGGHGLFLRSTGNKGEYQRMGIFRDLDVDSVNKFWALSGLDDTNAYHHIDKFRKENKRCNHNSGLTHLVHSPS